MGDVNRERGGAKLSTVISVALFVVFAIAMVNVLPVYVADYTLHDEMIQIARRPNIGGESDKVTIDRVMDEVKELELEEYINPAQIKVTMRAATRQISLSYQREVKVLPNWVRTFKFDHEVNERMF